MLPQAQWPVDEQLSADVALQVVQDAPPVPQVKTEGELQVVPEQHPDGHEVESQTQLPLTHRCPVAQAAFVPHMHAPPVQAFALVVSHATQAFPPLAHALTAGVVHEAPAQHPDGHEEALHTQVPPEQT